MKIHPTSEGLPDDGWSNPGARKTYELIAKNSCDRAAHEGRLTMAHIAEEEFAEVLLAASEGNVEELQTELIQASAVCLKWWSVIQRRKDQHERQQVRPGDPAEQT